MQVQHSTNLRGSVGNFARAKSSIEMNAMAFKMLSSGLYSDKIAAPIREVGCNAADAHVMVGTPDRPFEVRLPTILAPEFSIRDHGPGLTHDQVMNNYQRYFHSDKRADHLDASGNVLVSANDLTGCLGLGSKSPRAYTDQFTVKVSHGGTLRTYVCCDDEDGVPGVSLVLESEAPSNWPHGVEVIIPIAPKDFGEFERKAHEIFRWFRVPPINLATGKQFPKDKPAWTFGNFRYYGYGSDDWNATRNGAVVMGNVRYKFDYQQILRHAGSDEWIDTIARGMFVNDLVIEVPIGTVEITASRETIEYTPRTVAALRSAITREVEAITERITAFFEARPQLTSGDYLNLIDQVLPKEFREKALSNFTPALEAKLAPEMWAKFKLALDQKIRVEGWQDIMEECHRHKIPPPAGVLLKTDANGRTRSQAFFGTVELAGNVRVVVNDKPVRWKDRLKTLRAEDINRPVLVLSCPRDEDVPGICDILAENVVPIDYEMLSGQPKPPSKPRVAGVKRTPLDKEVCAYDLSKPMQDWSCCWEPPKVRIGDLTDKYYLIREAKWGNRSLSHWTFNASDPGSVIQRLQQLGKAGITIPSHLCVVTQGEIDKKKLDDLGFMHFDRWVNNVLIPDPRFAAYQNTGLAIDRLHFNTYYNRDISAAIYNVLFEQDEEYEAVREEVQRVLGGTPYLQALEELTVTHRQVAAQIQQNQRSNQQVQQDPLHIALRNCGFSARMGDGGMLNIHAEVEKISSKYPLLDWINWNDLTLPTSPGRLNVLLQMVAMAVAPSDQSTAEEN